MSLLKSLFNRCDPALITDDSSWTYDAFQKECVKEGPDFFICNPDAQSVFALFSALLNGRPVMPLSFRLPKQSIETTIQTYPLIYSTQLLTSGSSGFPKMACHSLENHCLSAEGANTILNLEPGDRWLLSLPLFHIGGIQILFRCFLSGAAAVLSKKNLADAILSHRISHVSLVPTQLYRLLQEEDRVLKKLSAQLKCVLVSGAAVSSYLIEQARSAGLPITASYGMTEMTSIICTADRLLPYRELSMSPEGEILVKGKVLFQGYLQTDGKIELPLNKDGWFATGDLGRILNDGRLEMIGRKDNLFISGGENIQPEEIEGCLLRIPGINQAIVVPVPDEEFGARPVAFVAHEIPEFNENCLKNKLRASLPSFKIPLLIIPFDFTGSLKPDRRQLKAFAASHAIAG